MSFALQKRRIKTKTIKSEAKHLFTCEPSNSRYFQHIKNFDAFETNFTKHIAERNFGSLKATLSNFYKSFKKNELLITDLSKYGQEFELSTDSTFLIHRANSIVQLLVEYFLDIKPAGETLEISSEQDQEARLLALKNIKAFIMVNAIFGKIIAHLPMFVEVLLRLTLQTYKLYFNQTLRILEALIRFNPETITQNLYPMISDILSSLPKKYFSRFSRVLALLLLENTEKPDAQEPSTDYSDNILNKFQLLMLSTPNFLESSSIILESLEKTIHSLISVNSDNLSKTLSYLKESKLIKDSAVDLKILKPVFEQCKAVRNLIPEVFASEFIIKFVVSKSNITEIFFILGSLLTGRRKFDVQKQLNEMSFFTKVIEPFFEILFHPTLELEDPEDISNANNPLSSARIQFIKVITNFCEGGPSNIKDYFVSSSEKAILNREILTEQANLSLISQSESLSKLGAMKQDIFENVDDKGLLHKIILLLKKTNLNSNYYFLFSSFIQAYLKQSEELCQIFVAHTGLLAHLTDLIVRNQITLLSNVQATYDLVAEIFKFNPYNMVFLEKLCKGFGWKTALLNKLEQNIINSNVFLRSAILSYEKVSMTVDEKENNLEDHIGLFSILFSKRIKFWKALVQATVAQTITYQNICCVNTILAVAVLSVKRNSLQLSLENLLQSSEKFTGVLDIWNQYYFSNAKSRFALELATSIKFIYFQDMMEKIKLYLENTKPLSSENSFYENVNISGWNT